MLVINNELRIIYVDTYLIRCNVDVCLQKKGYLLYYKLYEYYLNVIHMIRFIDVHSSVENKNPIHSQQTTSQRHQELILQLFTPSSIHNKTHQKKHTHTQK